MCWALDGDLDVNARLLRAAELWLWSATGSSTNDPVKAMSAELNRIMKLAESTQLNRPDPT